MFLKKKFRQLVIKIITKAFRLYYRSLEEKYINTIKIGTGSKIHVPPLCPQIENLQNDPNKLTIGENTHIRGTIFVYPYGDGVHIGNNSYIGENSIVRSGRSIIIGDNVLIAHNVTILDTDSHEIDQLERSKSYLSLLKNGHPKDSGLVKTAPIRINDHVWVSYGVSIMKGVTIGEGAIIGAGAVVTHDIPSFCLAVGNPAKVIKYIK